MEKVLPRQVLEKNYKYIYFILHKEIAAKKLDKNLLQDLFQEASIRILSDFNKKDLSKYTPLSLRYFIKLLTKRSVRLYLHKNYGNDCNERNTSITLEFAKDDNDEEFFDSLPVGYETKVEDEICIQQLKSIGSKVLTGAQYNAVFEDTSTESKNARYNGIERLKKYVG